MDTIIDLQRRDHAYMNQLFERYEDPAENQDAVFRELVALVTTHAFAEEEVLFPLSRRMLSTGEAVSADIESKHQRINELLKEMEPMATGEPSFEQRVPELFGLLEADAREEEDILLPQLNQQLGRRRLQAVGVAWTVAKRLAPNRAHPNIPRRPPGNVLAGIPLLIIDRLRGLVARRRDRSQ